MQSTFQTIFQKSWQWGKELPKRLTSWINNHKQATVIITLSLLFGVFSIIIYHYLAPSNQAQKETFIKIILQMIGGLIVFFGAYVGWQKVEANWKNVEINQESQITDRFIRANEQLGAVDQNGEPKIETRLEGIYALERLAWEKKDYHWTIMEILSAYVRKNAPIKHDDNNGPYSDIQAIINVIGKRRWIDEDEETAENKIDLSMTDLKYYYLIGEFSRAIFRYSNLSKSKIYNTIFFRACFFEANFTDALIYEVDFSGAELTNAKFFGAVCSFLKFFGTTTLNRAKGLTQEILKTTKGNEITTLPDHLERPERWKRKNTGSSNE